MLDGIYDFRRDCLLNELYYGHRLSLFSRINIWLEVVIVVGSGASGVSGWVLWSTYPQLKVIWAAIAATATLLAALRPVLHIDARVKRYSGLFASYRELSMSMADIVQDIAVARRVSLEHQRDVSRLRQRYLALVKDDDPKPSTNLVHQLQSEVNRRFPENSMFYPPSTNTPHRR